MKRYLIGLYGLMSVLAYANAETITSTEKPAIPIGVSYWGMVSGPSVGNPSFYQSDSITGKLDNTNPDNLFNQVKFDYKLDQNWSAGLVMNWLMQTDESRPFLMRESGFRIANKSIAKFWKFNWSGDLRYLLPTSTRAHNQNVGSLFQTLQIISADINKWNIGLAQMHTLRTFGENGGGKKLDMYISPFANYNFNDTTSATFAIESYPEYFTGVYDLQGWVPAPFDLSFGAGINITPDVNLNPVLITYPDNLNLNTTAFAAYFSAKLM